MKIATLALLITALLATSAPVYACSCLILTSDERVAGTDLIFIGAAKRTTSTHEEGSDTVYTVFAVKEMLKGITSDEIRISHPRDLGGNCGLDFKVGEDVLVLANDAAGNDSPPGTNFCMVAAVKEAEIRAALKRAAR